MKQLLIVVAVLGGCCQYITSSYECPTGTKRVIEIHEFEKDEVLTPCIPEANAELHAKKLYDMCMQDYCDATTDLVLLSEP